MLDLYRFDSLAAMTESVLRSGLEPDQLIARASVELDAGQPAAAAETLDGFLENGTKERPVTELQDDRLVGRQ